MIPEQSPHPGDPLWVKILMALALICVLVALVIAVLREHYGEKESVLIEGNSWQDVGLRPSVYCRPYFPGDDQDGDSG